MSMWFPFQFAVVEGFRHATPELAARGALLAQTDDWEALDRETQAMGLALAPEDQTRPWLEALAPVDPVRALDLALRSARYSFRFVFEGNAVARAIEVSTRTSTALPLPEFWRDLRRALDAAPSLRPLARRVAAEVAPSDLRLRAALAHVLYDEPSWWTAADQRVGLKTHDAETGALVLLALLRHDARSLRHTCWPPPMFAIERLEPAIRDIAAQWCAPEYDEAPAPPPKLGTAFRDVLRARSLQLIARQVPSAALLKRVRKLSPPRNALQAVLRATVIDGWERELVLPPRPNPAVAPLMDVELVQLRSALRRGDEAMLERFAERASADALGAFAGSLFLQWAIDWRPPNGSWAFEALARFPCDAWADGLAQMARDWLPNEVVPLLARMGTPRALMQLSLLASSEKHDLQRAAVEALDGVAEAQGLFLGELRDRLFPQVSLPAGASFEVNRPYDVRVVPEPEPGTLGPNWALAVQQLPAAVDRLEELMREGAPMSALHFTETWGLNPLLYAVAQRLVWGVFRGEQLTRVLIPGRDALELEDSMSIRPMHPLELSEVEHHQATTWLGDVQPFPQLDRAHYALPTPFDVFAMQIDEPETFDERIRSLGWVRLSGGERWRREGEGWVAEVAFEAEDAEGFARTLLPVEFQGVPARIVNELTTDLFAAARPSWRAPVRRSHRRDHHGAFSSSGAK